MTAAATRPWHCERTDCPAGTGEHDTYSGYRYGCSSGAALNDRRLYDKRRRFGVARPRLTSPVGVARRVEACHFMGYTEAEIGEALGLHRARVGQLRRMERQQLRITTVARVSPALETLALQPAPDGPYNRRTRNWARRAGFRSLLAWDDIDDPAEHPAEPVEPEQRAELDDHACDAVLAGRLALTDCNLAEQDAVIEWLWRDVTAREPGPPNVAIAERLGVEHVVVERIRRRIVNRRRERRQRQEES